jgi:hypothetical protein
MTKADDAWREAFVLELRLREVPGSVIGEALAEVDAHCADSGQTPQEAFGDPVRYAASRASGRTGPTALRRTAVRAWWIGTAAIVGALGLGTGITGALGDGVATLRLSEVLTAALLPLVLAVLVAAIFRPGMGRHLPVLVAVAFAVGLPAAVAARLLWPQEIARVPALLVVLVGVGALAVALWPVLSGRGRHDRVIDPRTGSAR